MNDNERLELDPVIKFKTDKVCKTCRHVVGTETAKDDTGAHFLNGKLCETCGHYRKAQ